MEFFLSEVFPASSITDATIITSFFDDNDALAVARGNRLSIYIIEDQYLKEPNTYELYGDIVRIIPIQYSHASQGNILIILYDLRVCILSADPYDATQIKTLSTGTLAPTCDAPLTAIKHALHPNAIVLQLSHSRLDVFPIAPNSTLDSPFHVDLGCKRIIDFNFIGPTTKVTRLVVLTEEFNKAPILRLIEIDSTNKTFNDDPANNVTMPIDTYLLIPYDPENKGIIVAFSTQRAIRVLYVGLTPQTTTATIFTNVPLVKLLALKPDFYIAIDQSQNFKTLKLEEEGSVRFIDVDKCPKPSAVAAISSTLAFVGSERDDSIIYMVEDGANSTLSTVFDTIRATGPAKKFVRDGYDYISIFQRAVIESKMMAEFVVSFNIECPNFSKIFAFYYEPKNMSCFLLSTEGISKIMGQTEEFEFLDVTDTVFDLSSQTIYFKEIGKNTYLHITSNKIMKIVVDKVVSVVNVEKPIYHASICQKSSFLAVSDINSVSVYNYNLNNSDQISKIDEMTFDIKGTVTAVALSTEDIAISTSSPDSVSIFSLNDRNNVVKYQIGLVIDIAFCSNRFFALNVVNEITVINHFKKNTFVFSCEGYHTYLNQIDDDKLIACGENPIYIESEKPYPMKSGSLIHSSYLDGQLYCLNSEFLQIGVIKPPQFVNSSFISETPLIDLFKVNDIYITVRYIKPNIYGVFSSTKRYELENEEPFYTTPNNEDYTGFYVENDNIFIASSYHISRFKIVDHKVIYIGQKDISGNENPPITKFGTFRDYSFIQFDNIIEFNTTETLNNSGCEFYKMFPLKVKDKITALAYNNQLFSIIVNGKLVVVYQFDEYLEKFTPLPPHHSFLEISAISVVGTRIVCGTTTGNVFVLEVVQSTNSYNSELIVQLNFSVGDKVTVMRTFIPDKTTLIGTEKGKIIELKHVKCAQGLYPVYKVLSHNMSSLGRFTKEFQRDARDGRYILRSAQVYDLDLIKKFRSLGNAEQADILKDSTFSVEEAMNATIVNC